MRISSVRKKSVSLIVVLSFLITLFPMALPAFAADYSRIGSVKTVGDGEYGALNTVKVETPAGLKDGDTLIVRLPEDFEFCDSANNAITNWVYENDNDDWYYGADSNGSVDKGGCYISIPEDSEDNGIGNSQVTNTPANGIFDVTSLDKNEIKIKVTGNPSVKDDGYFYIYLPNVYVDDGFDGDIQMTFEAPGSSNFNDGSLVVGRVTGGDVTIEVTDDNTFGDDGGEVTFRIKEDRAGAFEKDPESVKITLPDGFEWGTDLNGKWIGDDGVKLINGSDLGGKYTDPGNLNGSKIVIDKDELSLNIGTKSTSADGPTWIEIKAKIKVEDETDAKLGDIVAKVKGESDVTPSTITVGAYGDYSVDVTAEDPTTVYAGQLEQEIADFTIEESIDNSLIDGRSITLTLPDWAKWGNLPANPEDGVQLNLDSFPGKDGSVAKYKITNNKKSAAEIDFEDMEVVLSPDAPEGDLEVVVGGTATQDTTVKVATVKKPVEVTVDNAPTIVIGKAGQAIGTVTITEADAGVINEGKDLVLELPKDVEWDDYDVEVTSGDLDIGDVDDEDSLLTIDIDGDSNDASTIKITGTVTAYRTVPEGEVDLKVKGDALIEVNDDKEVRDYYDISGENVRLKDLNDTDDPVVIDDYDEDGLFEDATSVAKVVAAYVGTPAPGETQIKAVFTLGSKTYKLNDVDQTMDVAPYAKNGRTYLPMRYVAKALGIKDSGILWKNGTATFVTDNKVVSVKIGSQIMTINGAAVSIDAAPEIVSGRTMLPVKWIAAAFGVDVTWDAATQTVTVE